MEIDWKLTKNQQLFLLVSCFLVIQMMESQFTLSFTHRLSETRGASTYFSFCFPFSYSESQDMLQQLDQSYPNNAALHPGR